MFNNEAIQYAHSVIPSSILLRLHFDYFVAADPVYSGFFNYETTPDGRSYRNIACVAYPFHQLVSKDRQKTTIILPTKVYWATVIHEIGHVLHEYLNFEIEPVPVTKYAQTNSREAFADSFLAWIDNYWVEFNLKTVSGIDLATQSLLESL